MFRRFFEDAHGLGGLVPGGVHGLGDLAHGVALVVSGRKTFR
jgi:hypothetical protein